MNRKTRFFRNLSASAALIFPVQNVFAGDGMFMTYHIESATAIPTLSGSMLVLLSLLLFVVAIRIAKQKQSGAGKFFIALLGISALGMGGGGVKVITDSTAGAGIGLPLNISATTGRVDLEFGLNQFFHNDPDNQKDIIIDDIVGCDQSGSGRPAAISVLDRCEAELRIPKGEGCEIYCVDTSAPSDRRLKQNVRFITEIDNNIKLYSFNYVQGYGLDSKTNYVGVMAQDLIENQRYKNAVKVMGNNFYAVDYAALGLKMITLDEWQDSPSNIYQNLGMRQVNFSLR